MPIKSRGHTYGNLASYKAYMRPTIHDLYGHYDSLTPHQRNIRQLLYILSVNDAVTTWEMAKTHLKGIAGIRNQDKIYRRLLIGRSDRGNRSPGLLDMGIVIGEKARSYYRYRLSPYGLLYCIDVLNLNRKDYDRMAIHYSFMLPRIFGNWKRTKRILNKDAYNLKFLSQGIYLNNIKFTRPDNPLYELMMYLHTKYTKNFESISEHNLSEQISYWFYTFLLYSAPKKLTKILSSDADLYQWYSSFFNEAKSYYAQRLHSVRNCDIFN